MDEQLLRFIKLIPTARWRKPPAAWNEQLQTALSDHLVTVGWGGILKLTEAGAAVLTIDAVGTVEATNGQCGDTAKEKSDGKP